MKLNDGIKVFQNPLSPPRAKILAQGFSPILSTITRQPIEEEESLKRSG